MILRSSHRTDRIDPSSFTFAEKFVHDFSNARGEIDHFLVVFFGIVSEIVVHSVDETFNHAEWFKLVSSPRRRASFMSVTVP